MFLFADGVGAGWVAQIGHPGFELKGLHSDERGLLIVGQMGTVMASPDGAQWTLYRSDTEATLNGVARSDGGQVVAVAETGEIFSSDDLLRWRGERPFSAGALRAVVSASDGAFVVASEKGGILYGKSGRWKRAQLPGKVSLWGLWRAPGGQVWAVGEKGKCLCSEDNGQSFRAVNVGSTSALRSIHGDGSGRVAIGGSRGSVFCLREGAWVRAAAPWTDGVNVHFAPDGRLMALPCEESKKWHDPVISEDDGASWKKLSPELHSRQISAVNRGDKVWLVHGDHHGQGVQTLGPDERVDSVWPRLNPAVTHLHQSPAGVLVALSRDLFFRSEDERAFAMTSLPLAVTMAHDTDLRTIAVLTSYALLISRDQGKTWAHLKLPERGDLAMKRWTPLLVRRDGQVWIAGPDVIRILHTDGSWQTVPLPCQHATALAQGPDGAVYLQGGAEQNVFVDPNVWRASPEEPRLVPLELGGQRRFRATPLPGGSAVLHAWIDGVRHQWSWEREAWEVLPIRVHPVNKELIWLLPASDTEWAMLTYEEQVPWTRDGGASWQRAPRAAQRAHWSCALPLLLALRRLRGGELVAAAGEEHDRVFRLAGERIFSS